MNARLPLVTLLTLLAGTSVGHAQCGNSLKLTSAQPGDGDEIAASMAYGLSGGNSRLIVGAPKAEYGAFFNAGEVKLFAKISNQWGELATINKPTAAFHEDRFGASVAISNGRLAIGAPGHLTNSGVAYIYEFTGAWTAVATITASQSTQGVGTAVAIDGDYAFIGAPGTDTANNPDSGLVSIQHRSAGGSWSQSQSVSNTDISGLHQNRHLGAAISAKDGLAVIGAPDATLIGSPNFHGDVKVMRLNGATWSIEADDFSPAPQRAGAHFGAAVATDGVRVAVAAPDYTYSIAPDGVSALNGGAVWVMKFDAGAWSVESFIESPAPSDFGHFGSSLAINGDRLLVGEPGAKTAYAFRLVGSQWVLDRAYKDEDASAGGAFASSVALSDLNVFIGDSGDENNSVTDAGAVYLKALPAGYSDSCEGAIPVTGTSISGCTLEAMPDNVPVCGSNSGTATGKGVWVSWTPACSGNVIMDTVGSDFDTVLSIHTGCPTQAQPAVVACDDDGFSGPGNLSLLTFNYVAGTTYLINIRGYNTAAGNFNLRINQWQSPSNNTCSSPITVNSVDTRTFANCNATTDSGITNSCAGSAAVNDVWYRFTAPVAGTLNLDTNGSTFDTILSVFSGSGCPASASIACDDDGGMGANSQLSTTVQAGTYMIRVAGFNSTVPTGDGVLHVNFAATCRCDWNLSGAVSVQDIFDFLASYFAGNGDFNASGATTVQDIFDFLACYFGGCA